MGNKPKYLLIGIIALVFTITGCTAPTHKTMAQQPFLTKSPVYTQWLEKQSMLYNAGKISENISGRGIQWQHQYAKPQTKEIVSKASVWVLGYPGSMRLQLHADD
jgi:hypothetical protein